MCFQLLPIFSHIYPKFINLYLYLIDKCDCCRNNGGCQHNCRDTLGSYYCSCHPGYELRPNNKTCKGMGCLLHFHLITMYTYLLRHLALMYVDVNECSFNNGGCEQQCINHEGSHVCNCFRGHEMINGSCQLQRKISI